MHFESNNKTVVRNHEGAFFIAFGGFCACLIVNPCNDLEKL